ncbi:probable LRR receptor-like serine/threonine-protein kinase At1g63430 [Dendrobium catenatum]|uniref:Putative LRR receptor-like serine/threonine-protein kinase n=1 Tax=Dendrobium catenatum TaxID=906689 RepID=A0A2I0VMA1_9ASPA|nr:probable LRR receptor-like serine/threonine-protein kinase At1g63430 [Dendrobium catenatum]PKU64540.1 putative LRR receptor-like serine/threonine-protein kinase [Dendrobium catenatum]
MRFPTFLHLLLATQMGYLFLETLSVQEEEVSALKAFVGAISEDPLAKLSDWSTGTDPCGWYGIKCSDSKNHVISLNFANSSLKGFLAPELGSLNSLQELILNNNLFYGAIPKQIGMLKNLRVLDLSVNRLLGPIPSEIGDLSNITTLNLHFNGLTGAIPIELGNLVNLAALYLDRNKLSGPIPGSKSSNSSTVHGMLIYESNTTGICQLTKLKVADFSYNFLLGKVPTCLEYLPRTSFQGNCFQDKDSIYHRSSQQCISAKNQETAEETYELSSVKINHQNLKEPVWLLILEVFTGAAFVIFFITCIVRAAKRCKSKSKSNVVIPWKRTPTIKDHKISIDDGLLKTMLRFSRQELEVACEDFSNIIGSSPDSKVYKGTLKDGPEIAVISLAVSVSHWPICLELCFQKEVANLSRLNHENTSKLLGYCKENEPFLRMLVFEYASNGTLYEHLHYGDTGHLSWLRRLKIAIGVARGLRYLHTEVQPPFTISELNSNAVYLTEDFSPKLVDFERWTTIVSKSDNGLSYLSNGGLNNGFLENSEARKMYVQGNTYDLGVLLLELISGRPPHCKERGCIVNWAMEYLQHPDKLSMLVDPELKNVKPGDLSVLCSVISLCIDPEPSKRPSMQILCAMLEDGIDISVGAVLSESSLAWAELALSV